jgi:hypothetical protein
VEQHRGVLFFTDPKQGKEKIFQDISVKPCRKKTIRQISAGFF